MNEDQNALNPDETRDLENKLFEEFGVTGLEVDFVRTHHDAYLVAFGSYEDVNDKLHRFTVVFKCHPEGNRIVDLEIADYTNIRKGA